MPGSLSVPVAPEFDMRENDEPVVNDPSGDVESVVRDLLTRWDRSVEGLDRRRTSRVSFQRHLLLVPLDGITEQPLEERRVATGRNISLLGVSFTHREPLPNNKVAIAFELPDGLSSFIVARLNWCRFTRSGLYEGGGNFLHRTSIALTAQTDWQDAQHSPKPGSTGLQSNPKKGARAK